MTCYKEELRPLVFAAMHHRRNISDDTLVLLKLYLKRIVKRGKKITKNNPNFLRTKQAIDIFCKSSTTTNKLGRSTVPVFVDSFLEETYQHLCFKSLEEYLTTHNKYNEV